MTPYPFGISSPDIPDATSLPPDPEDCEVAVDAEIGVHPDQEEVYLGESGTNRFRFTFVTIKSLERTLREDGAVAIPYCVVVPRFSWEAIAPILESICLRCEGDSWDEVVEYLAEYGQPQFLLSPPSP
jgi:hypothetical protein